MKQSKRYDGVIVPMVTPFTDRGDVDPAAAGRIAEFLMRADTSIFLLGTTGEASSMTVRAKIDLVQSVIQRKAGATTIYVGLSDTCLEVSCELASRFSALGADVAVAHVPSYYPLSDDDIVRYFERLADDIDMPLVLYNIPMTTGMSIPLQVIDRLSHHPNIVGLKDSERDSGRLEEAIGRWRDRKDFSFLSGCSALCVSALSLGADGIVPSAGNLAPDLFVELFHALRQGRVQHAKRCQDCADRIADLFQNGRKISQSIPVLKAIMHLRGFCSTKVLAPCTRLGSQQMESLKRELPRLAELIKLPGSPIASRATTEPSRIYDIFKTVQKPKHTDPHISTRDKE